MLPEQNNLHKQLKKMIIIMGLSLVMGVVALVIAFAIKKNLNKHSKELDVNESIIQNRIDNNFSETCKPLTIEYKENYIAINSKKCNKLLIISVNTGKVFYKNY